MIEDNKTTTITPHHFTLKRCKILVTEIEMLRFV
jgi:hypothetical protein